jgi:hypothetical protein
VEANSTGGQDSRRTVAPCDDDDDDDPWITYVELFFNAHMFKQYK